MSVARGKIRVLTGGAAGGGDRRAEVQVVRGRIDLVADATLSQMEAAGLPFYNRGDVLVRLARDVGEARRKVASGLPGLVPASSAMVLEAAESVCRFTVHRQDGEISTCACPRELPGVILSRVGRWPFPPVRSVAAVPILREDGGVGMDGYDGPTQTVVCLSGEWPNLPDAPTQDDARAALRRVQDLIAGFSFATEADRAVTLAAFLSAVLRPGLPSCPGFAWSAPVRGSGKSKLADIVSVLATGSPAAVLSWPAQPEEQEKRLGAALLAGDPVIAIDNVEGSLRGDCLNSMLTQAEMAIRMLGASKMPRVATGALLCVNGNNLQISGDLTRRILVSHLDPQTERPELRVFDFEPVARARAQRVALVTDLLTIGRWAQGSGVRTGLPPLGSFEVWSRRVRDPLVALGLPDPCAGLDELHKQDPEREAAIEVLTEWRRAFGGVATTVANAIRKATLNGDAGLRDALDAVAGSPGGIAAKRLGRYLLRIKDRILGGMVLRRSHDAISNSAAWAVEVLQSGSGFPDSDASADYAPTPPSMWLGTDPGNPDSRRDADSYRQARDGE